MGVPSPAIPSFTDGTVVHQADLNALASNLTNLYLYNNAGFRTQRPCVIAQQTTGQSIPNTTDTLVNFQAAAINTDNMWTASVANTVTIQHAGIYLVMSQTRYPSAAGTAVSASILANGTSFTNSIATQLISAIATGSGPTVQCSTIVNLAAGATLYLNAWQNTGGSKTLQTDFGGTSMSVIFLTPST